jgi:capsule biosynthesis phosphatase
MAKKIICDLDDTITIHASDPCYSKKKPNTPLIEKLILFKSLGYEIVIFTARNMRKFNGDIKNIEEFTLPVIEAWLIQHSVPFDEIIIGKPWCDEGFYVDDKAIRPDEFIAYSEAEIGRIIK